MTDVINEPSINAKVCDCEMCYWSSGVHCSDSNYSAPDWKMTLWTLCGVGPGDAVKSNNRREKAVLSQAHGAMP